MTALIGTLNKHGVAIAADSAATVSNGRFGKVYNTANKIFTLSKIHPVGIMVCGNAEFKGIPWDLVIKTYRKQNKGQSYPKVKGYVEGFIKFLRNGKLPIEGYKTSNEDLVNFYVNEINILFSSIRPARHPENTPFVPTAEFLKTYLQQLQHPFKNILSCCEDYYSNFKNIISIPNRNLISQINNGSPDIELDELLSRFVWSQWLLKTHSELVIVGYGDDEIFPSLQSFKILSAPNQNWGVWIEDIVSITQEQNAAICPFAQRDEMSTMIEGIHPFIEGKIYERVFNLITEIEQNIINQLPEGIKVAIKCSDKNVTMQHFMKICKTIKQQAYTIPLISHISQLEKEDLALLSESLIGITSLRKKVTMEQESVGGPIDVAVISKHDGFIWLKRKHYFNAALNPQFRDNYYNEIQNKNPYNNDN